MAYTDRAALEAELPRQFLRDALDDDGDGAEDPGLLDRILANAAVEIDGILGQRYAVPFPAPAPAVVAHAAKAIVLDSLHRRRGYTGDQNPWEGPASHARNKLGKIARGEEPLTPQARKPGGSVSFVTTPAKTHSHHGHLAH